MLLLPPATPRRAASKAEIAQVEDLATLTVEVPYWVYPPGHELAGEVMQITLRGIPLEDRRAITRGSLVEGKRDDQRYALLTCLYGVVEPKFQNEAELLLLGGKNAHAIDAIANTIWSLTAAYAHEVAAEVRELAGLPPATGTTADPVAADRTSP